MNKNLRTNSKKVTFSVYGKREIAKSTYHKGRAFILASILLDREENNHHFVCLHLLCQGLELLYKGTLLLKDFDRFKPKIRGFGHNLITLYDCWSEEYNFSRKNKQYYRELTILNGFFSNHLFRYGNITDILMGNNKFKTTYTLRHAMALMVKIDKALQ